MKNNETGRSMVEMLGVLAIIGVLSVAGIAGYGMAMKKIKVNDTLSIASQCAVLARTYQGVGATTNTSCTTLGVDSNEVPTGITNLAAQYDETNKRVVVALTAEDTAQCNQIAQMVANGSGCNNTKNATLYYPMD